MGEFETDMQTQDENFFYSIAITPNLRILVGHLRKDELNVGSILLPSPLASACTFTFSTSKSGRFFKKTSKHHVLTQTTSSPPFFLRDSRASETRARVKITPRKKRRHAAPKRVCISESIQIEVVF